MSGEDEAELTKERGDDAESQPSASDGQEAVEGQGTVDTTDGDDERPIDSAATSFVEVEEKLGHLGEGMQTQGQAIDVERIPAEDVPDDYPAEIDTEDALTLVLELVEADDQTVMAYFEWPENGTDDRLAKLLDLREVPVERFADLHGETILLTVENGHYVPVLPEEEPRGSEKAVYGIFAGIGVNLLVLLAAMLGIGGIIASGGFVLLWLLLNLVVLPLSVYLDAWDLRTTTDWEGGPLFWGALSAVPGLNVVMAAAYLLQRQSAQPYI